MPRTAVLITRPEPGASETAERLRAMRRVSVVAPLLRIRPLGLLPPPGIGAVVVASGNAVPCLPPSLHALPLLAVGDATAERARAAGFTQVHSADGDASDLAALCARVCAPGTPLLLATARGQGAGLAAMLRAAGFAVHRRAVYAATPATRLPQAARDALHDDRLEAALFLSAETARAFVRLLPPALVPHLAAVDALAIGAPAADVLCVLPWRQVRVSAKPTLEAILALL